MFTGIVQGTGNVQSMSGESILTIGIQIPSTENLEVGGSVAIDGVCLTATSVGDTVTFDIIPETVERTTLGSLACGSNVNVERALKFGDELGGHLLSGHIMGTAEIVSVTNQDYQIQCP
ncbi:MAG: riboflavin synthase, partial [Candidatus Poseidoniales archaeon]|nr:riboflavin synthase [Candidatus Poseidoniales archaeon]